MISITPAWAKGCAAFHDGLSEQDHPYLFHSPDHREWSDGYSFARRRHEEKRHALIHAIVGDGEGSGIESYFEWLGSKNLEELQSLADTAEAVSSPEKQDTNTDAS